MTTTTVATPVGQLNHVLQTISAGSNGDPVYINRDDVTIVCRPDQGSPTGIGKIQFTTSPPALVRSGGAHWIDWGRGNITHPAADVPEGPITAIRGVSIFGPLEVEVLQ